MNTITVALPDGHLLKLKEIAERPGVAPEYLVWASRLPVFDVVTLVKMAH